jgi:hypothetical protein
MRAITPQDGQSNPRPAIRKLLTFAFCPLKRGGQWKLRVAMPSKEQPRESEFGA